MSWSCGQGWEGMTSTERPAGRGRVRPEGMARLRVERDWEGWIQGIGVRCRVGGRMRGARRAAVLVQNDSGLWFLALADEVGVPRTEADMPDRKSSGGAGCRPHIPF